MLLTATQKPDLAALNEAQKRTSEGKNAKPTTVKERTSDEIVSPLNLISNRVKRSGVLGNYCQILVSVCTPIKKKQNKIG